MSFGVVFQVTVIEEAVKYIDELHRALFERLQSKGNIPRNQNPLYHDKIDNERNSTQNIISLQRNYDAAIVSLSMHFIEYQIALI